MAVSLRRGTVLLDGKAFFPIGLYSSGASTDFHFSHADLAAAGFNVVSVRPERSALDALHRHGLKSVVYVGEDFDISKSTARRKQRIERLVAALSDHPGLMAWESINEPSWTYFDYTKNRVSADGLLAGHRLLRRLDPAHLILITHAPHQLVSTLQHYSRGVDALSTAMYPIVQPGLAHTYGRDEWGFHGDYKNQGPSSVGEYTTKTRRVAGPARSVWTTLQAFAWDLDLHPPDADRAKMRYPTYLELRAMAYGSIVRGANGLLFWGAHHIHKRFQFWDDLCRLAGELRDQSEVFVAPTLRRQPKLRYVEVGNSDDTAIECLFKVLDGRVYMITANTSLYPVKAVFERLPGLGRTAKIEVVARRRSFGATAGGFEANYDGLEVRTFSWLRR